MKDQMPGTDANRGLTKTHLPNRRKTKNGKQAIALDATRLDAARAGTCAGLGKQGNNMG